MSKTGHAQQSRPKVIDAPADRPFPLNRVKNFYFHQAEELMDAESIPELIPQFPGLDGGAFGHWGQNPEDVNYDHTLNDVNTGNVVCQVVNHFGSSTNKGVAVRIDDVSKTTALFDPERMSFVDVWQGGFVKWGVSRFGVMGGVQAAGRRFLDQSAARWKFPADVSTSYLGFYRHGQAVVFSYQIGEARVLDMITFADGQLIRDLQIQGQIPSSVQLVLMAVAEPAAVTSKAMSATIRDAVGNPVKISLFAEFDGAGLLVSERELLLQFSHDAQSTRLKLAYSLSEDHIPAKETADSVLVADSDSEDASSLVDLQRLTQGSPGQWLNQQVTAQGQLGEDDSAFAIDTLTVPYAQFNPFGTPMRLCGVGSLSDGRIVVSTILGDVWLVTIANDQLDHVQWQRIAAGLYQPLGLTIYDDQIVVLGRDQITRLHDLNGDNEADFYECITNRYPTTGGHDFCTSLQQDARHNLYWFTASQNFGVARMSNPFGDGPREAPVSLATGLRNSNGIGVSADGSVVLATVQEGTWTPASALFEVGHQSYHGLNGPREGHGKYGYDLPMCFLPRGVDNSSGELAFLPDDSRLGPLSGAIVGTSFGDCSHYLVLREVVNGKSQGGIMPLPGEFLSGACRLNFNRHDGCLYVAGTEGWQSYARENGCLQRLRYTGRTATLPTALKTHANGITITFNRPVSPESVTLKNVFCQQWNYLYSSAYGSPEFSIRDPGRQAHDYVPVKSVHLLPDGRSVFLEIPELHPVMQFHVHMRLVDTDGNPFKPDLYTSIFETGSSFTQFPGYKLIAKRRAPDFPVPEKFDLDPRLAEQDRFGTNFGWVQQAEKLSIYAVAGLQYQPQQLRVTPGQKVALTFHNADPSMPHNIAIVHAAAADHFAEQAMMLASNPRAIASHYVPEDPAEICFSPILTPQDQYTVYFEAPSEHGEYRILCTYPGHARVMRASLFVLPAGEPLPASSMELSRRFVRQWTLDDLADAADTLAGRSFQSGKAVFSQAGCIKCHRMKDEGSPLGPDLTRIGDRFRGTRLLQHILEPSLEINKQHQAWVAVTTQGRSVSGLMTGQTESAITLLPNPLKPETEVTLLKEELEELFASPQSTMPTGLLMVFEKDEILDLLAYLQAAGEPLHRVFRK